MAKRENEQARSPQRKRKPEVTQEEKPFEQEVSEGKALAEKVVKKAGKKLEEEASGRLEELREQELGGTES